MDNSATTKCCGQAMELMIRLLTEEYGNPSSLHSMGARAEAYVKEAKEKIAKTLKASEKEIVFTSGGTESNNLAILGGARANRRAGRHIITTQIEHASVWEPCKALEEDGCRLTALPVDADGVLCLDALEEALTEDTALVSMMLVNNEIGTVEPVEEAARRIRKKAKNALIHVDAIQAYGKMPVHPKKLDADLLSVSGHKINGPKGVGFLYVREKTKLSPVLFGGGQQKGIRSGTENVPGIAALGEAASLAYQDLEKNASHLRFLRERLIQEVKKIEGVTVTGESGERFAPHIVSVSVEGVRSEVLLHALEERGVYVSAGSACSSNKPSVSRTLLAIGLKQELLPSTVRFSFCAETTEAEIEYAAGCLRDLVPFLRKFTRK